MEPVDLLCSRNARPEKALVGRAQWKINQPPSLKRERASLEGLSVTSFDARNRRSIRLPFGERNKQAWKDHLYDFRLSLGGYLAPPVMVAKPKGIPVERRDFSLGKGYSSARFRA